MHRSYLGSLSLVLLLTACESNPPSQPDAAKSIPSTDAAKKSEKSEKLATAASADTPKPNEDAAAKQPTADEDSKAVADPTPTEPDAEPDVDAPTADANIDTTSPSAPLATLSAFAGPLRFSPVEAGDGELPVNNRAQIEAGEPTMMDHPIEFGWAADSGAFGYCQPSGGADCDDCRVLTVASGAVETWTRGSECNADDGKEIAAKWKASGFGKQPIPKQWAFGRDLVITWKYDAGAEAEAGAERRLSQLQIGAKVGDEEAVYFVTMKEEMLAEIMVEYLIFPELIVPSPDGQQLAIMSHSFAGEYSDTISLRVEDVTDFAFEAYYRTARGLLASKPARAVELHEAAAKIKPGAAKVHDELIRARARVLAEAPSKAK